MTFEEFDNTLWKKDMACYYSEDKFEIISVNFTERLIEIFDGIDFTWVRCENVELNK